MSKNYFIKERLLAFGAKFDVYDENRNEAFLVEADKFDIGKNINIYTPDKSRKLMYFRQQLRIGAHKYKVYDSNGMEIAAIEKEFMVPKYNISGVLGRFVMSCDSAILGRNYTVEKDGFVQVSQAMRDTIKQINELSGTDKEIQVYSSFETEGFVKTMDQNNYNDLYDGLTIHPYSGTPTGSGEDFYDSAMKLADKNGIAHVQK